MKWPTVDGVPLNWILRQPGTYIWILGIAIWAAVHTAGANSNADVLFALGLLFQFLGFGNVASQSPPRRPWTDAERTAHGLAPAAATVAPEATSVENLLGQASSSSPRTAAGEITPLERPPRGPTSTAG